eukprot:COSAG06_NODE_11807_length_1462_cov_2.011739_1_plen_105_part_00
MHPGDLVSVALLLWVGSLVMITSVAGSALQRLSDDIVLEPPNGFIATTLLGGEDGRVGSPCVSVATSGTRVALSPAEAPHGYHLIIQTSLRGAEQNFAFVLYCP